MLLGRSAWAELAVLLSVSAVPVFRHSWRVQLPSWPCACPPSFGGMWPGPRAAFPPAPPCAARALAALLACGPAALMAQPAPCERPAAYVSFEQHCRRNSTVFAVSLFCWIGMLSIVSPPASQSGSFVWRSAGGHSQPCLSAARQLGWAAFATLDSHAVLCLHILGAKTTGVCSADAALLGFRGSL